MACLCSMMAGYLSWKIEGLGLDSPRAHSLTCLSGSWSWVLLETLTGLLLTATSICDFFMWPWLPHNMGGWRTKKSAHRETELLIRIMLNYYNLPCVKYIFITFRDKVGHHLPSGRSVHCLHATTTSSGLTVNVVLNTESFTMQCFR